MTLDRYELSPEQLKALLRRATQSDLNHWRAQAQMHDPGARYVINNIALTAPTGHIERPLPPSLAEHLGID